MSLPSDVAAAALADAKAYLRLDAADEDSLLTGLLAAGASLCERFTGLALWLADRSDALPASVRRWQRLPATPVVAIASVASLDAAGTATALPVDGYAIDLDAAGDGWVRLTRAIGPVRLQIGYRAGLAADWPSLPVPLAQGIVRFAAHYHAHRDAAADAGPPAAVAALWRPWRRIRL